MWIVWCLKTSSISILRSRLLKLVKINKSKSKATINCYRLKIILLYSLNSTNSVNYQIYKNLIYRPLNQQELPTQCWTLLTNLVSLVCKALSHSLCNKTIALSPRWVMSQSTGLYKTENRIKARLDSMLTYKTRNHVFKALGIELYHLTHRWISRCTQGNLLGILRVGSQTQ